MTKPWECKHIFGYGFKYLSNGRTFRVLQCRRCGLTRLFGETHEPITLDGYKPTERTQPRRP